MGNMLEGRKQILKCLIGSHNYNLNTIESDKDYKILTLPTFEDLYTNKKFSNMIVGDNEDFDIHDIRKIVDLFWKGNINYLELLFSKDFEITAVNKEEEKLIRLLFENRNEIAKMNLPYLWNACIGMHTEKKLKILKATEGTQHLLEKYGYDTKQAMHSLRVLLVLQRYADDNFKDFGKALWFEDDETERSLLLDIKNGRFSCSEMYDFLDKSLENTKRSFEEIYMKQEPNEKLHLGLADSIKQVVKLGLNIKE